MISQRDPVADFLRNVGIISTIAVLCQVVIRILAAPLTGVCRWGLGVRYLSGSAVWMAIGTLLLMNILFQAVTVVVSMFLNPLAILSGRVVTSMEVFADVSYVLCFMLVLQVCLARYREHKGVEVHSQSSGVPWAAKLCSLGYAGPWTCRLVVEPAMWIIVGWYFKRNIDVPTGLYFQIAGCALAISNNMEHGALLNAARDIKDAELMRKIFESIGNGKLKPGGIYQGLATPPNVARVFFADYAQKAKTSAPSYAPDEDPALAAMMIEAHSDTLEDDAEAIFREEALRHRTADRNGRKADGPNRARRGP